MGSSSFFKGLLEDYSFSLSKLFSICNLFFSDLLFSGDLCKWFSCSTTFYKSGSLFSDEPICLVVLLGDYLLLLKGGDLLLLILDGELILIGEL
jgi:hypothetical protein